MGRRGKTALERYCRDVLEGRVTACAKVRAVCDRLLREMADGCGRWHFDRERAEEPVRFIEEFCRQPSGRLGTPLVLEDYQKAWTEAMFGFVDSDGLRRFNDVFICVGRKNGKTTWVAGLELYMGIADGEGAPQIYNAANTYDQAELGFNAALKMVRQSTDIAKHVRKTDDRLTCDLNMGFIKPISANPKTLDGFDVHMGVIDEIHAAETREVYDLLKQGMAAREQPMIVQITTNGFVRGAVFDQQYEYASRWLRGEVEDERFLAFVYELDSRDEWDREECWVKANPGLGTVKNLDFLRGQVARAKQDPSYRPSVMTKDFNMAETASTAWLTYDEAVNEETVDMGSMGFRYGICGFDASDFTDLTCAQMLMMRPGDDRIYERSMYWIPEEVMLNWSSMGKDRDVAPYRLWIARGLMREHPGNYIDKRVLVEWIRELYDTEGFCTYAVAVDPYHMDESVLRELEYTVGRGRVIKVRQGVQTLSEPMKHLRADLAANRIVDNHHPINEWCRMNTCAFSDINGNIRPDKRNPKNRIDGLAAELDAYVALNDLMEDYRVQVG